MKARTTLLALLLFGTIPARLAGDTKPADARLTTVIMVRHAEKILGVEDPSLRPEGEARAAALARALRDVEIKAVYVSSKRRTQETAAPSARILGLTPIVFDEPRGFGRAMAARIRDDHRGETVLIVGHSDTLPEVMKALGIAGAPSIGDADYDNLFVCTFVDDEQVRLLRLHFGE